MSMPRLTTVLCLVVLIAILSVSNWRVGTFSTDTARTTDPIVATVDSHSITLRAVEQAVALPLYGADQQRHQLLLQGIQRLIDEELLAAEASRKEISVSQLLDEASQSESVARLANLPAPVKRLRAGQATSRPADIEEQGRIRQALLLALRRNSDIHITLPALEPPVLSVGTDDDPRVGPENAPITIVEFSDFQCPYCQKSVSVLQELRRVYGDKIRLVYRDFPGQNHPYALPAAEAAQCAGEQNKFWEYHDLLFNRQTPDKPWNFPALAKELGLQSEAFSECVHSGRFREEITRDLRDGLKLGVTSTPTFFINGRPIIGAQPLAVFQSLINRLLDQPHPQS